MDAISVTVGSSPKIVTVSPTLASTPVSSKSAAFSIPEYPLPGRRGSKNKGKGNGVAAQAGGNAGAASGGTNENGAASNAGVTGAVNAAMDVVQQTDDAVGTEESKRKKGVA